MKNVTTCIVAVFVTLMAVPASPNTDAVNPLVRFFEGRLSIRAVNIPLKELVQEISKKSGIVVELRDAKAAEKRITVDLVNLPPALALEEILRGFSFALLYNNKAHLAEAVVLSPVVPSPQVAQSKPPPPRPQPVRQPSVPGPDFEALLNRNRDEGMQAISLALKGNNRRDKLQAVDALENFGSADDQAIIRLLGEALADSDKAVKKSALGALVDKEGAAVIPLLAAGLKDPDPSIRVEVLDALSEKGQLHLVRSALSDPDQDVREKAQELLETERKATETKASGQRNTGRPAALQRR